MLFLTTNKKRFEGLKKIPLLFLHKVYNGYQNLRGEWVSDNYWTCYDKSIYCRFTVDQLPESASDDYTLVIINPDITQNLEEEKGVELISVAIHDFAYPSESDLKVIFDSYMKRCMIPTFKYAFMELLWVMYNRPFYLKTYYNVITKYDQQDRSKLLRCIASIARCLSQNKQNFIRILLDKFNVKYEVYRPSIIFDALNYISSDIKVEGLNFFEIVDNIYGLDIEENTGKNDFLKMIWWLRNDEYRLNDYNILSLFYSFFSTDIFS